MIKTTLCFVYIISISGQLSLDNGHNYDYNYNMLIDVKKKIILCFGCVLSILLGTFIYVIFRGDTYISKIISSVIEFKWITNTFSCFDNVFVKYYLPDFLWGFSLCCAIQLILNPKNKKSMICCSMVAFLCGLVYEIIQWVGIVGGTGDIIDVLFYFLSSLTVSLICMKE